MSEAPEKIWITTVDADWFGVDPSNERGGVATEYRRADLPAPVRVKPLVWEESVAGRYIGTPPVKLADLAFWVFEDGGKYRRCFGGKWLVFPTLEAAKAAAQADYTARILAAIEAAKEPTDERA